MRTYKIIAVICAVITTFFECSPVDNNHAGTATQTGNPVAASLYNPGGSPAAYAKVKFYPRNYNPRTKGLGKTSASTAKIDSATTDASGNYTAKLDTGMYTILASGDSGLAYQDSITVIKGDTAKPAADTLKPAGIIKGVIQLQSGDDARTVFILFMGTHTFTTPDDAQGNFIAPDLAEGKYRVRILTTLDNYAVMDTSLSAIAGKESVLPRPIQLRFTGIPVPTGLRISYDTLKQIVTLIWDKPTMGTKVQGYKIYRKNQDSTDFVKIKGGLKDTVYSDSTGVQDITYEYRVAVVDTNATEGVKSAGVKVFIASCFNVDTVFNGSISGPGQFSVINDIAIDFNNNLYLVDWYLGKVLIFDANLNFLREFNTGIQQSACRIDLDDSGNIYLAEQIPQGSGLGSRQIMVCNPTGTHTDSIWFNEYISDFAIHHDEMYVVLGDSSGSDSVLVTKLDGTRMRSWRSIGGKLGLIGISDSGDVFVSDDACRIQIFDTSGNFKSAVVPAGSCGSYPVFDKGGNCLMAFGTDSLDYLGVFNRQCSLFAKYRLENNYLNTYGPVYGICTTKKGNDFAYLLLFQGILKLSHTSNFTR